MARPWLARRALRASWFGLLLLIALTVLVTSCVSPPRAAPPTPTVPAVYATAAAATAVWQELQQRPLHLPIRTPGMPCPTTPGHLLATGEGIAVGRGPVHVVHGQSSSTGADERQRQGVLQYADAHAYGNGTSGWGGVKVLWVIGASYTGSVLIRGHQLDGSHEVRFNGGLDQLFLEYANDLAAVPPLPGLRLVRVSTDTGWTDWPSETRLQAPGCYAYQVNGLTFSEVIVFQAVLAQHL
jgi:hypothetical protein